MADGSAFFAALSAARNDGMPHHRGGDGRCSKDASICAVFAVSKNGHAAGKVCDRPHVTAAEATEGQKAGLRRLLKNSKSTFVLKDAPILAEFGIIDAAGISTSLLGANPQLLDAWNAGVCYADCTAEGCRSNLSGTCSRLHRSSGVRPTTRMKREFQNYLARVIKPSTLDVTALKWAGLTHWAQLPPAIQAANPSLMLLLVDDAESTAGNGYSYGHELASVSSVSSGAKQSEEAKRAFGGVPGDVKGRKPCFKFHRHLEGAAKKGCFAGSACPRMHDENYIMTPEENSTVTCETCGVRWCSGSLFYIRSAPSRASADDYALAATSCTNRVVSGSIDDDPLVEALTLTSSALEAALDGSGDAEDEAAATVEAFQVALARLQLKDQLAATGDDNDELTPQPVQFEGKLWEGRLAPFRLERYFALYEFKAPYLLCCSDVEPLQMGRDVLSRVSAQTANMWQNLSLGYTESRGNPRLLQLVSDLYQDIPAEGPLAPLICAPQEAIYLAMNAMFENCTGPASAVVVMAPGYQSLHAIAKAKGATVLYWLPREDSRGVPSHFHLDDLRDLVAGHLAAYPNAPGAEASELSESVQRGSILAIVVNFPHNPTGFIPSILEFGALVEIARAQDAYFFCDEMYL